MNLKSDSGSGMLNRDTAQSCPDRQTLVHYLSGRIGDEEAEVLDGHLADCMKCGEVLSELESTTDFGFAKLTSVVGDRARNDRFEDFYEQVKEGLEAGGARHSLREGEMLGHYRILSHIGAGGMGEVFKATNTKLDRTVALKLLSPKNFNGPEAIRRFEKEVKAVAKLSDSSVVQAFDAGEIDGVHFLVMEYVDGPNLAKLVEATGILSFADASELIRQAALALQHVHENDLVHRDVKPANLLLSRAGQLKLTDLGLVRATQQIGTEETAIAQETSASRVLGTMEFMAPEQGTDSRSVDLRADIYSLGCTFYFLLTGRPPFRRSEEGGPIPTLIAHATREIPPISGFRNDVPDGVLKVVSRMLNRNQQDRFPNLGEVAGALEPFVKRADIPALMDRFDRGAESLTQDAADASVAATQLGHEVDKPKSHTRHLRKIVTLGLLLLFLAAVIIRFQTANGQIEIRVSHPDVEVSIDENSVVAIVDPNDKQLLTVEASPGTHTLKISKGGFEVYVTEFTIRAMGKESVSVKLVPNKPNEPHKQSVPAWTERLPKGIAKLLSENKVRLDDAAIEIWHSSGKATETALVGVDGVWTQYVSDGVQYKYLEIARSLNYVDLVDDGRAMVRLRQDRLEQINEGVARRHSNGVWARKQSTLPGFSVSRTGSAIRFDGNSCYVKPKDLIYDGSHPLTIEAWAARETSKVLSFQTLIGNTTPNGIRLQAGSNGDWRLVVNQADAPTIDLNSDPKQAYSGFAHIAGVIDGTNVRLFVNGRLQAKIGKLAGNYTVSSSGFMIGANMTPGEIIREHFSGLVSAVRFSSCARYSSDFIPPAELDGDEHTIACYEFSKTAGDTLADKSRNGLDGRIIGASEWVKLPCELLTQSADKLPPQLSGLLESEQGTEGVGKWQVETTTPRIYTNVVAWSPDQKLLATGSHHGAIRIYESSNLGLTRIFPGRQGQDITALTWSPDSKVLAAQLLTGETQLWSREGELLKSWRAHRTGSHALCWHPDGESLASGGNDNVIQIHDRKGRLLMTLAGHTGYVHCVAWSPDGHRLASGSADRTARVWSRNGDLEFVFRSHSDIVQDLSWHPDSNQFLSTSFDGSVWKWELEGVHGPIPSAHASNWNFAVKWNPDGNWFARASLGRPPTIWKGDGVRGPEFDSPMQTVHDISWSPDNKALAGVGDGPDEEWRLVKWGVDGKLTAILSQPPWPIVCATLGKLSIVGFNDGTIRAWNEDGSPVFTVPSGDSPIKVLAPSPMGKQFATAANDGFVRVWSAAGEQLFEKKFHRAVEAVAWEPDGNRFAVGLESGEVAIWSAKDNEPHVFRAHDRAIRGISWSVNGVIACGGGDQTVRLFSPKGKLMQELPDHAKEVVRVVYSPDGKLLATGCVDRILRIWSVEESTSKLVATTATGQCDYIAWSPDGQRILIGDRADGIRTLTAKGAMLSQRASSPTLTGIAWFADGRRQIEIAGSNVICIRDIDSKAPVHQIVAFADETSAVFDAKGTLLHGDPESLDKNLRYLISSNANEYKCLTPSEFQSR